jgi:hypothetical protein
MGAGEPSRALERGPAALRLAGAMYRRERGTGRRAQSLEQALFVVRGRACGRLGLCVGRSDIRRRHGRRKSRPAKQGFL